MTAWQYIILLFVAGFAQAFGLLWVYFTGMERKKPVVDTIVTVETRILLNLWSLGSKSANGLSLTYEELGSAEAIYKVLLRLQDLGWVHACDSTSESSDVAIMFATTSIGKAQASARLQFLRTFLKSYDGL
jgi:hypothetical protein